MRIRYSNYFRKEVGLSRSDVRRRPCSNRSFFFVGSKNSCFLSSELGDRNLVWWVVADDLKKKKNIYIYIQGVPRGMDKTSGECSLC